MAQTTQIVPEFNFPHVMSVINDYTLAKDVTVEEADDTSIKQIYAVMASKGIDNTWVKLSSRTAAVKMFGDSNFKKYGQPLMQALDVLDHANSQVWMMRVMPTSATYANTIISIGYKADAFTVGDEDVTNPHKKKFRIKVTATPLTNLTSDDELKAALTGNAVEDSEGFSTVKVLGVRYTGRGECGNYYSLRLSKNTSYESETGITMYNFAAVNSESAIEVDTTVVGSLVTTTKYETATQIDDLISDASVGTVPVIVHANEDAIQTIYDAYCEFIATARTKMQAEYESKLVASGLTSDELRGKTAVSGAKAEAYAELNEIEYLLTSTVSLPDVDCFDPFFGLSVASSSSLPLFKVVGEVPTTDLTDLDASDYTTDTIVDFTTIKGCVLTNGSDGEFSAPGTSNVNGVSVSNTINDEVTVCYINAYNGNYDRKVLSSKRMPIDAYFDANYPSSVKQAIVNLALTRGDGHVWLDGGLNYTISASTVKSLANQFSKYDDSAVSVDISGYTYRESSTNKKCDVTITMFLAGAYNDHLNNVGFNIPFVKGNCQLSGHVKNSLFPLITDADTTIQELLYDNRLNYFECVGDNIYQRCVQNTTQKAETDLLEENNDNIIKKAKTILEADSRNEIYNFADDYVRQTFVNTEKAKFASWNNNIVQSFDLRFATSEYEFEKSILHLYAEIVLRGLTKTIIVEISINKREYTDSNVSSDNEE